MFWMLGVLLSSWSLFRLDYNDDDDDDDDDDDGGGGGGGGIFHLNVCVILNGYRNRVV